MDTSRFDLRRYLKKNVACITEHGDEWEIPCPHCDSGGSSHAWINVEKLVGLCYRCHTRYDVLDLIQHIEGVDFQTAVSIVIEDLTPESRLEHAVGALDPPEDPCGPSEPEIAMTLPLEYKAIVSLASAPAYARRRGLSEFDCLRHKIGWCDRGFFQNRLIVPVVNLDGRLVSFVARWMGKSPLPPGVKKVLYPKGSRISRVLFNHRWAKRGRIVVITEGVFDALRVGSRAVALFGKHASRAQLEALCELGTRRRLVVLLDNDARDDAEDLATILSEVCPRVSIATLPSGRKDPGESTRSELSDVVARASDTRRVLLRRALTM